MSSKKAKPAEATPPKDDNVNHPHRYTKGEVECIVAIDSAVVGKPPDEVVCVANIIKYLWRYEEKEPVRSLLSARWYLDRLIDKVKRRTDMKWATIIIAALVCGCGKLYTEHDMQEAARKAAMEAVDDAEIKSWNCMSCGCQLIHWYTMGGGGDPDVQAAQREIDGILDECRTRINEANRRCRAKILNKCPNAEEMFPAYLRPYIPNELMNAEKTRAKCASWTNWTNRIKWHPKHTYCNGNPYRDNVEISPKEEN